MYSEYLDINSKKNSDSHLYLQAGLLDQIKKAAGYFLAGAGGYSSYITINSHYDKNKREALLQEELAKTKSEVTNMENKEAANNLNNKMQLDRILRTQKKKLENKKEKSELMRLIEERQAKFKDDTSTDEIRQAKSRLHLLELEESRIETELHNDIVSGVKFAEEIRKQTEEKKALALLIEDVKKSTIFDFDTL